MMEDRRGDSPFEGGQGDVEDRYQELRDQKNSVKCRMMNDE